MHSSPLAQSFASHARELLYAAMEDCRAHTLRPHMGAALTTALLAASSRVDDELSERCHDFTVSTLETCFEEGGLSFDLESGLAIAAVTVRLSERAGLIEHDPDLARTLMETLLEQCDELERSERVELLYGLAGIGVAATAVRSWPSAMRLIERVGTALVNVHSKQGEFRFPRSLDASKNTERNWGVAHGLPGVFGALVGLSEAGQETRSMAIDSLGSFAARARDPRTTAGETALWPQHESVDEADATYGIRNAWCYGDLGAAAAAMGAYRALDLSIAEDFEAAAAHALRRSTAKEVSGCADAAVCHGASGSLLAAQRLALALPKLHVASDAIHRWRACLLEHIEHSEMILPPGYEVLDASILQSPFGVVLTLAAEVGWISRDWDCVLGLSVPKPIEAWDLK